MELSNPDPSTNVPAPRPPVVAQDQSLLALNEASLSSMENFLSQTRLSKFRLFEDAVVKPFAAELTKLDSDASCHIAGSFKSRPHAIREGSDIDTLILSPALKDPQVYVQTLKQLASMANAFHERTGLQVVFFTQAKHETSFTFLALLRTAQSAEKLVPCHFLLYRDTEELFQREPYKLGFALLTRSQQVEGKSNSIPAQGTTKWLNPFAQAVWDIERTIADLVLNTNALPENFVLRHFVDNIAQSLSLFGTSQAGLEDAQLHNVLKLLRSLGAQIEDSDFDALLDIRKNGSLSKHYSLDEVLKPALNTLLALRQCEQDFLEHLASTCPKAA